MSRRQEIVDILKARLQTISGIKSVDEWKMARVTDSDMPAVVLRDVGSSVANETSSSSSHSLQIEIDILVSDKETTMPTLRNFMSEVLRVVGSDGDDNFYEYRTYNGDEIIVEHQDKIYGGAQMKFTVVYDATTWEM